MDITPVTRQCLQSYSYNIHNYSVNCVSTGLTKNREATKSNCATRWACFGRVAFDRVLRAPAVPCCSACGTPPPEMPDTTRTHLRRWSRDGGKMAAASRDRKRRRSAVTRRRWRIAEVVRDEQNAERRVQVSCQPFDASSCIAGFETRFLPATDSSRTFN